ncbi:MAG TPA: class I SAM-dependent methyltransferase [Intrasporangium sp.]|nr:class I SAM-dependent methyltransferase [Intrasporangium sp.]
MPLEHLHADRDRAESFGSSAEAYDLFRPGYPRELFDDLLGRHVSTALDVGCGTGKVALDLSRRGVRTLGIDPDQRMAADARQHGVDVEVARFESWDDAGRRFDLITCGHSWHWIDPSTGPDTAARLLAPGGRIARFWNYHIVQADLLGEFEASYAELAPTLSVIGRDPSGDVDAPDPFGAHSAFTTAPPRTYRWHRRMTAAQWAGLIATFGDHRRLGPDRLGRLTSALQDAIERHGGVVTVDGGTYLLLAQRA